MESHRSLKANACCFIQAYLIVQEVEPDVKNKDAYENAFKRHDEISKGLFEGKGAAYV